VGEQIHGIGDVLGIQIFHENTDPEIILAETMRRIIKKKSDGLHEVNARPISLPSQRLPCCGRRIVPRVAEAVRGNAAGW